MQKRIPTNSYRIQLSDKFGLKEVRLIVPYLSQLGIDMIYLSPFFEIEVGSLNPYKIVSPNHVNPRFGGEREFNLLSSELNKYDIMHMIDIVPNHMGATVENPWWYDVLKCGKYSKYADFFDIDWKRYAGKVLLPILGDESKISKEGNYLKVDGKCYPLRKGTEKLKEKKLLEQQNYIFVHWKETHSKINYRRFFDISDLVGLKMERKDLFEIYHKKVFEWVKADRIQGLRVDHPDGLKDPAQYLQRLKSHSKGTYNVCEKILQVGEPLRKNWASDGTVGYDALNSLNSLFVDPKKEKEFNEIYQKAAGEKKSPSEILSEEKKKYIKKYLKSELDAMTTKLLEISGKNKREFYEPDLKEALLEWLSKFPVYRSYYTSSLGKINVEDRKLFVEAANKMRNLKGEYREFFEKTILEKPYRKTLLWMQQIMPAVFAKGFEDTFLYQYTRLTSLNEVGSTPTKFGLTIDEFHNYTKDRQESHPYSMVTTSTHDTKRGEDVRYRISVLSEIPKQFEKRVKEWRNINGTFSDKNFDYFFYQTLIGFWPASKPSATLKKELAARLNAYVMKAVCEAKKYTDWIDHNTKYENELSLFVDKVVNQGSESRFWKSFYSFIEEIDCFGKYNSFSSLVIKLGLPGVIDFYQGCELWRYELVDPDNRRRVNFDKRVKILNKIEAVNASDVQLQNWFENPGDSKLKMFLLYKGLHARLEHKDLFVKGKYIPIKTKSRSLIGFSRVKGRKEIRVYAARFYATHQGKIAIPFEKGFVDIFTGKATTVLPFSIQIKKS